ncbi:hypothetical protein HMI55_003715 [Coelomomyces lativittatus]|nr:hypothetical protein HMI55_003715 [Coelomomyces lativittatus]
MIDVLLFFCETASSLPVSANSPIRPTSSSLPSMETVVTKCTALWTQFRTSLKGYYPRLK